MEVEFYKKENGDCPVENFLFSLDRKLLAKTMRTIELLEKNGTLIGIPYSRYLCDEIFELRTIQSSNITRILYFFVKDNRAILTNGLIKKTSATPSNEILIAKKYKADYERRTNEKNKGN